MTWVTARVTFPRARGQRRETLALPVYPELKHRQLEYVNDKMSEYYSRVL